MTAPIITLRPGPVIHVWKDGAQIAEVPLSPDAALELAEDLVRGARVAMAAHEPPLGALEAI